MSAGDWFETGSSSALTKILIHEESLTKRGDWERESEEICLEAAAHAIVLRTAVTEALQQMRQHEWRQVPDDVG